METKEKTEAQETKEEIKEEKAREKKAKKLFKALHKAQGGFFKDFKTFISKGNVIQLAVAFIMGAAFTTIVNSLVGDIFMPFFNLIFGGSHIDDLKWVIQKNLVIYYGKFIFAVLNFLLVAVVLFIIIKLAARAQKGIKKINKKGQVVIVPPPPPEPTKIEQLLADIKELLAKQTQKDVKDQNNQ